MSLTFTTEHAALERAMIRFVGIGTGIEPGTPQIDTVTIDAAEANVKYDITVSDLDIDDNPVNTETISFTASATPTIAEIRDGLIAAAIADAAFSALVTTALSDVDALTLTAIPLAGRITTIVADDGSGSAMSIATTTVAADSLIFWLEQEDERPPLPDDTKAFAQLIPTSRGGSFGIDEVTRDFIPGQTKPEDRQETRTEGLRRMSLSVEVFTRTGQTADALDAHRRVENLLTLANAPIIFQFMNDASVSIVNHEPARNLDAIVGEEWEARALADLVLLYPVGTLDTDTEFVETIISPTEADGTFIVRT